MTYQRAHLYSTIMSKVPRTCSTCALPIVCLVFTGMARLRLPRFVQRREIRIKGDKEMCQVSSYL